MDQKIYTGIKLVSTNNPGVPAGRGIPARRADGGIAGLDAEPALTAGLQVAGGGMAGRDGCERRVGLARFRFSGGVVNRFADRVWVGVPFHRVLWLICHGTAS